MDDFGFKQKPSTDEIKQINNRITKCIVDSDISNIAIEVGENGKTFTPAIFQGKRRKENFLQMQLFGIDFDCGISFEKVENRCREFDLPIAFAYKTFSHTEQFPKFRIVFCLETVIEKRGLAEWVLCMLFKIFPEADKSCKDCTRIFFGGKGLLAFGTKKCLWMNIKLACEKSIYTKNIESNGRHYIREINSLGKRYNIGLENQQFYLKRYANETDLEKNGAIIEEPYYKYKGCEENAPIFILKRYEGKNDDKIRNDNSKGETMKSKETCKEEKMPHHYLKRIGRICHLYKDAFQGDIKDFNKMSHNQKMLLMTNLLWIDGGRKLFLNRINESDSDYDKWVGACGYYKKAYEYPYSCNTICPYAIKCDHETNICMTLKKYGQVERIKLPDYSALEETVESFKHHFIQAVDANDKDIHVIQAQTALGKTEIYCDYIKDHMDKKKFMIAVPTNKLKMEVVKRLEEKGIKALFSIALEDLDFLSENEKNKYTELYQMGYGDRVKNKLKKCSRSQEIDVIQRTKLNLYLRFPQILEETRAPVVVITHDRLLKMKNDILEGYEIIIDEDILLTIFRNQKSINILDIRDLLDNLPKELISQKEVLEFLLNIENNVPVKFPYHMKPIGYRIFKINYLQSNLNDLKKGSILYRIEDKICYVYPEKMGDGKRIVLSATTNEEIYRRYFVDRKIHYYVCPKVKYKGKVVQYAKYTLSRLELTRKKEKKIDKKIKKITGDIPRISYKNNEFPLHFGNTEGKNMYEGKDIAVIGTPRKHESAYYMMAYAIDDRVVPEKPQYLKVENGEYRFSFFTYKNVLLRKIQMYMISSELEQCIGRARLLRKDNTVYVFSDFPVEQAMIRFDDYLE